MSHISEHRKRAMARTYYHKRAILEGSVPSRRYLERSLELWNPFTPDEMRNSYPARNAWRAEREAVLDLYQRRTGNRQVR